MAPESSHKTGNMTESFKPKKTPEIEDPDSTETEDHSAQADVRLHPDKEQRPGSSVRTVRANMSRSRPATPEQIAKGEAMNIHLGNATQTEANTLLRKVLIESERVGRHQHYYNIIKRNGFFVGKEVLIYGKPFVITKITTNSKLVLQSVETGKPYHSNPISPDHVLRLRDKK